MGTTRLLRGAGALTLVAVLVSCALAVTPGSAANGQSYSDANAATPQASSATTANNEETLKRASRVMHAKVKSPDGKPLGRVHDLVLTPDLNGISYVAVSSGGFLGMGGTLHAVPWDSLSQSVNDTYSIPISEQQFQQSKGFSTKAWPSSAETGWMRQGQETVYREPTAADSHSVQNRRFTRIKGSDAKGTDGRKIGDVHDLVIVMDTGRIAYDIVAYGGLLGFGQRLTAVPESAVTLEPALRVARIEATPATLHAHSFTPSQWPDLSSPSYSQQLARAFGVQPSGTALGYLPAEGGAVAAAPSPRTPARPSARSTTPPVSGALPSTAAPTAGELTGTFNPASVTSIEGTVAEEGKFQPTASAPEMLWLRVRTSNGQIVLVNLGLRSYISSQDFYIVPGDRIHLSGSEVTNTSGKRVFLPTQVKYGEQTLRLRSDTGAGLWEGQATTPGAPQPGTTSPSSKSQTQSRAGGPGTALGYTPAEEQATTAAAGAGRAAGPSLTQFAPSGLIALGAFDLSSSRTIDGTVTEVGKSQSAGGPDVIWLRVQTSDGRLVNVQVGPRDYVSKQDFIVVTGDRVHLTGWNARPTSETGATPVFIVADISQDGHTLALRNRSGEPLWTSPSSMSEQSRSTMTPAPTGRTQGTETPSQQTTTPGTAGRSGMTTRAAQEPNEPNKPTEPNKP